MTTDTRKKSTVGNAAYEKTTVDALTGYFALGLYVGYTSEIIEKEAVVKAIQTLQSKVKQNYKLTISFEIYESTIICEGQNEPHLHVGFSFPISEEQSATYRLNQLVSVVTSLMHKFEQNRVMLIYSHAGVTAQQLIEKDPTLRDKGIK